MAQHDDDDGCPGRGQDLMALGPETAQGLRPYLRHTADCQVKAGLIRPMREGEPMVGGGVCLEHKEGHVYAVVHEVPSMVATMDRSGPAQVATDDYRQGWDRIFGSRPTIGEA